MAVPVKLHQVKGVDIDGDFDTPSEWGSAITGNQFMNKPMQDLVSGTADQQLPAMPPGDAGQGRFDGSHDFDLAAKGSADC